MPIADRVRRRTVRLQASRLKLARSTRTLRTGERKGARRRRGVPEPWLLRRQEEHRTEWLECPDAMYFSGRLEHEMHHAASAAAASLIHAKADEVCLMSNATDAAVTRL